MDIDDTYLYNLELVRVGVLLTTYYTNYKCINSVINSILDSWVYYSYRLL